MFCMKCIEHKKENAMAEGTSNMGKRTKMGHAESRNQKEEAQRS